MAGTAVPAHRHAHHEACRSTGEHPPAAANTVRAAQDSLLLTNQERFETVTYMIDGRIQHQDSHGGGGMIEDGATQWMTAGSGILHIETPPEDLVMSGGLFHGVQLWVNLPAKEKMIPPAYQGIDAAAVQLAVSADAGALVRVIAGEVGGHRGPGSTHTPITLIHATVLPGARLQLPWDPSFNALIYVLAGAGRVGTEGSTGT